LERWLHHKFLDRRSHYEWFNVPFDEIKAAISSAPDAATLEAFYNAHPSVDALGQQCCTIETARAIASAPTSQSHTELSGLYDVNVSTVAEIRRGTLFRWASNPWPIHSQ
ncbi:MAG: GIY-YIG nuclease family protein, partial [Pseudomonadota bacterium]|nr:GIY-YIG nuclease family protein [Pseudomonadota bacterium]